MKDTHTNRSRKVLKSIFRKRKLHSKLFGNNKKLEENINNKKINSFTGRRDNN